MNETAESRPIAHLVLTLWELSLRRERVQMGFKAKQAWKQAGDQRKKKQWPISILLTVVQIQWTLVKLQSQVLIYSEKTNWNIYKHF